MRHLVFCLLRFVLKVKFIVVGVAHQNNSGDEAHQHANHLFVYDRYVLHIYLPGIH